MASNHAYGRKSLKQLSTCDIRLQMVARRGLIICPYDVTVVYGWRGQKTQNELVRRRLSRSPWPTSKHNKMLDNGTPNSEAIDIAPWVDKKIPWKDTDIFCIVAGSFLAAANELGIPLRWGGDWDMDGSTKDHTLLDYGHLELIN